MSRIDGGTQSAARTSHSKDGWAVYKDANAFVGKALQVALDAFNWLFSSKYKFPGAKGNSARKSKKGKHLF